MESQMVEVTGVELTEIMKDLNSVAAEDLRNVHNPAIDMLRRMSSYTTTPVNVCYTIPPPLPTEPEYHDSASEEEEIAALVASTLDYVHKGLAKQVADRIASEKGVSIRDAKYKRYIEWFENGISTLKEALETYFPGNWDLQDIVSHGDIKTSMLDCLSDHSLEDVLLSDRIVSRDTTFRRILIHFPVIQITNGSQSHTIKNLFIRLEVNYKLGLAKHISCFRTTKTVREYLCNYNHSHAQRATDGASAMCLGITSLDTLVAELTTEPFNELKWELLFQQLPDYLSWESLDGGPYVQIDELTRTQHGPPVIPNIPVTVLPHIVRKVCEYKEDISVNIHNHDGGTVSAEVVLNYNLWRVITKYTPSNLCFPFKEATLESIWPTQNNQTMTNERIRQVNAAARNSYRYKGQNLKLQVEFNNEEEEKKEEPNVEMLADQRLLVQFKQYFGAEITKHIQDVYWHGIEESSTTKGRA